MIRVVLVRAGEKYGPEFVTALLKQIGEQAEVVTLTDRDDTPGKTERLREGLEGWWAKLELFSPRTSHLRPFLYLDLDSFVFGDLARLVRGEFTMVRDFSGWVPANSCAMWLPKDTQTIWDNFNAGRERHIKEAGGRGDQWFLGKHCKSFYEDGLVTSYKKELEPRGVAMQFHGYPKMPDVKTGWVAERWKKYAIV